MKKILFILLLFVGCLSFAQNADSISYSYDQQGDGRDAWKVTEYDNSGRVASVYNVYERPYNWRGLKIDLFRSPLFARAISDANPNVYSTLLKVLTDGEKGDANEQTLLQLINMLGLNFSSAEKQELNGYFEENNFTIRL